MTRPGASDSQTTTMPPMRPFVIGTAGHVDHGKSTLVKALTGIDPDRLAEEKARAMTIDLGFAWLTLPGGQSVSVVDVPGHERFIKNMLAGVGGIDAALLVVAADEGPMPQTVEHLAILDLLGVDRGVIVLTKADAAEADWLDLVREEVRELVSTTTLGGRADRRGVRPHRRRAPGAAGNAGSGACRGARHVRRQRSAVAGRPRLLRRRVRYRRHRHPERGRDRHRATSSVSTPAIAGRACGDCKATRRKSPARCRAGARQSISPVSPRRRSSAATCWPRPGSMTPSQRLDARLRLLPDAPVALKQNDEVDFFTGAAELPARITLLDRERLDPGESAWVQFRFRAPIAVLRNDRFIVRRPSPSETLGGGEIIDPNPPRHRRFRPETIAALETLAAGAPDEILLQALEQRPIEIKELTAGAAGLSPQQVDEALAQLIAEGDAVVLGGSGRAPGATDFVIATSLLEIAHRADQRRSCGATTPPSRCDRDWRGRRRGAGSASPSLVSSTT